MEIQSDPALNMEGFVQTELEQTVSLLCLAGGGSGPQAEDELVWLRNGALVQLKEGNKKGRSSVCVSPVTREDNDATFTCQLKGNASANASATLNVTYAPMLSGVEKVAVEEEAELVLQCDVRANPPVSVSWQQEGSLLDLSTGGFMLSSDGFTTQLTVNRVDRSLHQGAYECVIVSSIYGPRSKIFQVTVNDKTMKFPLMPMVAGLVVVVCTTLLAIVSRWKKIAKCCSK
ncbi:transmembrane and immunoglobulin domain-containing protein 1 [Centroberyx gerrardi]|uniref:transmembrane and immunoglobulin domain-containing protein 1 n=1 Tax=Centroberyx gerrardi TaxID=166262 RepID=UPI003AAE4DFC